MIKKEENFGIEIKDWKIFIFILSVPVRKNIIINKDQRENCSLVLFYSTYFLPNDSKSIKFNVLRYNHKDKYGRLNGRSWTSK